jgi:hypothetical protein
MEKVYKSQWMWKKNHQSKVNRVLLERIVTRSDHIVVEFVGLEKAMVRS